MANMRKDKNIMPEQDPNVRNKNFDEVALGYGLEAVIDEAQRCIQCKNAPCVTGCPVGVKIPEFIKCVANNQIDKSAEILGGCNSLAAVCGRVCPQETQCEAKCVRAKKGEPVAIGRIERFVGDYIVNNNIVDATSISKEKKKEKVAICGAGPSGLTCGAELAKMGYDVTIFEVLHKPGGVLVYGIPEFRLPKSLITKQVKMVEDLGVKIETNVIIGKSIEVSELIEEEGFSAVYIASGAGLPNFQNIAGENGIGVYSANEFLARINLMKAYDYPNNVTPINVGQTVVVIGGGNVAMDAARSAIRMGAENVKIVYRRSEVEMPARVEEIHHAKEEGIEFVTLTNPTQILLDDNSVVKGIECLKMMLTEPDDSGRRRPVAIKGSEYVIDCQTVVVAIGNKPNPLIPATTKEIGTHSWGGIITEDDSTKTTMKGVFAGGDAVKGAATVILAMGDGKSGAREIDEYIKSL